MLIDILMALVFALIFESFTLLNRGFKQLIILAACVTVILIYFISGYKINFVGDMDFGVWIMFIIFFNKIVQLIINKLKKENVYRKENI